MTYTQEEISLGWKRLNGYLSSGQHVEGRPYQVVIDLGIYKPLTAINRSKVPAYNQTYRTMTFMQDPYTKQWEVVL